MLDIEWNPYGGACYGRTQSSAHDRPQALANG